MIGPVRPRSGAPQRGNGQRGGIRSEIPEIGIQLNSTQPTRIVEHQRTAVGQGDHQALPPSFVVRRAVLQRIDRPRVVDQEPASHPEAQTEGAAAIGRQQQNLAEPLGAQESCTAQGGRHGLAIEPSTHPWIHQFHTGDPAADQPLRSPAIRLDLDQLWHAESTPSA